MDSGVIAKMIAQYESGEYVVKNNTTSILSGLISNGSREQVFHIVEHGGVEVLVKQLELRLKNETNNSNAGIALEALENLIKLIDPQVKDCISEKCQSLNCKSSLMYL